MGNIIQYVKHLFHAQKLRINLLIFIFLMFACITVPSILLLIHYNNQYSLEEIKRLSSHNLDLSSANFTQTLLGTKKVSTSLLSNHTLQSFLNSTTHSSNQIIALENALYNLCSTSPNTLSAYLYDNNSNCYYTDYGKKKELLTPTFKDLKIYSQLVEGDGQILCFNAANLYQDTTGISVCRIINDLDTLEPKGILVLNITLEALERAFSTTDEYNQYSFIYDTLGQAIFSNTAHTIQVSKLIKSSDKKSNTFSFKQDNQTYVISYSSLDDYPFLVGIIRNIDDFGPSFFTNASLIFIVLAVNLFIMTIGIYIIAHALTTPIVSLSREMMMIQKDGFEKISTSFMPTNEIGYLVSSYNIMIDEIQSLLKKEIQAEKQKRYLELNLLQAQIKPHFLYNTLDTARALALSNETDAVNRLLKALGCYYQSVLSKGKSIVTIQNEINSIRQYIAILECEKSLDFQIIWEVEDSIAQLPILKFVLQPLVENSIKHGLYGIEEGIITIRFLYKDDTLTFQVQDNGIGMKEDVIHSILSSSNRRTSSGFGLSSTIERMSLHYGADCTTTITSEPHQGTIITFQIKQYHSHFKDW